MDWNYESWASGEPYDYMGAARGGTIWDSMDYHVDLGCGRIKKGRIGIDHMPAPGVNVVMDLNTLDVHAMSDRPNEDAVDLTEDGLYYHHGDPDKEPMRYQGIPRTVARRRGDAFAYALASGLPFEDGSIESIITHHALEHIGEGFLALIDEVYRVLKPNGIFRAITPLYPSTTAVSDADHRRYFMEDTWAAFCGTPGDTPTTCWLSSFSVPYTQARFELMHKDMSPPTPIHEMWTPKDAREIRVALRAVKN